MDEKQNELLFQEACNTHHLTVHTSASEDVKYYKLVSDTLFILESLRDREIAFEIKMELLNIVHTRMEQDKKLREQLKAESRPKKKVKPKTPHTVSQSIMQRLIDRHSTILTSHRLKSLSEEMMDCYIDTRWKQPPKKIQMVNGSEFEVEHYTEDDWREFGDDILDKWLEKNKK